MMHATQLAVFSLWTGLQGQKLVDAWVRCASDEMAQIGCTRIHVVARVADVHAGQTSERLPTCPQCLALCHLAMVEHDRFREMEP